MSYKGQSCDGRPAQGERVKPAPFQYRVTRTVAEATDALAEFGDEAAVLAGGQSLVPLLNLRLARPRVVVDINPVTELGTHHMSPDAVVVGAMVRARQLERCDDVAAVLPLLRRALSFVAHPQIRSRTTIGGNVAHADPASELPAVLVALGGAVTVRSAAGERNIAAAEFFQGPMMTAIGEGELITGVTFPVHAAMRWEFDEVARTHGDFAMVGACVGLACRDGVVDRRGRRARRMWSTPGALLGRRGALWSGARSVTTSAKCRPW